MRAVLAGVLGLLLSSEVTVVSAGEPPVIPSPRDLYVGCSLLVHGTDIPRREDGGLEPYSAAQCGVAALAMIVNREGGPADSKYRFCLPKTIEIEADPGRAMAAAYVDYYERLGSRVQTTDGRSVYLIALMDKWPCAH